MNYYVITGGPGAGKTTLIEALRERGYTCVEEAGRQIIQEQLKINGDALPWANLEKFKELMLDHALLTYEEAKGVKGPVFFDRGIVDLLGYDVLTKAESKERLIRSAHNLRYNNNVFIAPPWEAIFCNDAERKQTFEEAIATYTCIKEAYLKEGYKVIELPLKSVQERIEFIINSLN